jgi:hypothetical protein
MKEAGRRTCAPFQSIPATIAQRGLRSGAPRIECRVAGLSAGHGGGRVPRRAAACAVTSRCKSCLRTIQPGIEARFMRSTLEMCIRMIPSTMARLARQVSDTGLAGPRSPQASRPGKGRRLDSLSDFADSSWSERAYLAPTRGTPIDGRQIIRSRLRTCSEPSKAR